MYLTKFNRHSSMSVETRTEIVNIITELGTTDVDFKVSNYLYGLFDGFFYQENLTDEIEQLKKRFSITKKYSKLAKRIEVVYNEVLTYPIGETQLY